MTTLAEFLLGRLAVAEEIAEDGHIWNCPASPDYKGTTTGGHCECAQRHIIADIQAKRRIVEDHNTVHAGCPGSPTLTSDDGEQDGTFGGPCAVLRNLASVYSDHPSYREAWRP